jgi:tetratricopeptide (TPR) repeat protein
MRVGVKRIAFVTAACLLWLTGCETTSTKLPDFFAGKPQGQPGASEPDTTGSLTAPLPENGRPETGRPAQDGARGVPPLMGVDPYDDLSIAKQYYRQGSYGLSEKHFRRAVEHGPRDAEAWLGLAASYDRLKRFDLADRAYEQLLKIVGPTPEILNNQGFSFILRGDYRKAREILSAAQAKDPANPYIKNNIDLLEKSARTRKAVE